MIVYILIFLFTIILLLCIILPCVFLIKDNFINLFDKYGIYVINLDRSTERMKLIDNNLKKNWLKYERISAVDGDMYNNIDEMCAKLYYKKLSCTNGNNTRHIGCYFSHLKCLELISKKNDNNSYLILEDDALINNNFSKNILKILEENKNKNYDFIWLNDSETNNDINSEGYGTPGYGTHAYFINKKAANILLNLITPGSEFLKSCDRCLYDIILVKALKYSGINFTHIQLVGQNKNFNSDIND